MSWAECPLCQTGFPVLVDQGGYYGCCRCGYTVSGGAFKEEPPEEPPMETVPSEACAPWVTVYVQDRDHPGIMHGRDARTIRQVEGILKGSIGKAKASISRKGQSWLEWTKEQELPEGWDALLDELRAKGVSR
jgi:hypothetical protein